MANVHFGNIGDVWKHLPLADVLLTEMPSRYMESHAGSAVYPLFRSTARDYGVYYFMAHATESPELASSSYFDILGRRLKDGAPVAYPGSPLIAMTLLGSRSHYVFCDLDQASLADIARCSADLQLPDSNVGTIHGDGIQAICERAIFTEETAASGTFVFIDPYEPFAKSQGAMDSIQLLCSLTKKGIRTVFWYGYRLFRDREALIRRIKDEASDNGLIRPFWCGDIKLLAIDDPAFSDKPGVLGCGIVCGNLSDRSIDLCQRLGRGLEKIYSSTVFPSGSSGALEFNVLTI